MIRKEKLFLCVLNVENKDNPIKSRKIQYVKCGKPGNYSEADDRPSALGGRNSPKIKHAMAAIRASQKTSITQRPMA